MAIEHKHVGPSPYARGMNLAKNSIAIQDGESPHSVNWTHRFERLLLRERLVEYSDFGTKLTGAGGVLTDPWIGLGLAEFNAGTRYVLFHSKNRLFSFDGTTMTERTGSGVFTSGNNTAPWTSAFVLDTYFACNGMNELISWTGTGNAVWTATGADTGGVGGNNLIGKFVLGYAGRVMIANNTEATVAHPQRLRWCADSDFTDWDSTNGTGAGAVDFADSPGFIVGLSKLDHLLVVFKEDSIIIGIETGDINQPFNFPYSLRTGCFSGGSVQAISPTRLVFLGRDDFYVMEGTQVAPLGTRIQRDVFYPGNAGSRINWANYRQCVSWVRPELGHYYCAVPGANSSRPSETTYGVRTYVYNYLEDKWWIEEYPTAITASLITDAGSPPPGLDDYGTAKISDSPHATKTLGEYVGSSSVPTAIVASTYTYSTDWRVFGFSQGLADHGSPNSSISNEVHTKDFRLHEEGQSTLYRVVMQYDCTVGGASLGVEVSTDFGATKIGSSSTTLVSGVGKRATFRFNRPITGDYHRLILSVTNNKESVPIGTIQITGIEFWYLPRGEFR
jgi:hypothetical protein